ncbi:MAG TPA: hypothetical protein DCZ51_08845 [Bacteroidales bacterium]|jgi:hypothetical protein|nr:hypothetical protein [Bacteroidales bacterium]
MKKTKSDKLIVLTVLLIVFCFLFPEIKGQSGTSNTLPQFLFPGFTKSLVKMKDGRKMTATLNYNMVDEEMIFDQNGVYMALEKPQEIDTIYLQNRRFVPVEKAFYEVLIKSGITMFIQHKSRYSQKGTPTAYGMTTKTAGPTKVLSMQVGNQVRQVELPDNVEVTPANVYWLSYKNGMYKFTTEKQFLKIFPENEIKLKEFMKTNKIDIKVREDLLKLGEFCNSLVK